MTANPNTATERQRLALSIEKLEADLAALTDGGLSRCAECPNDCATQIEADIEQARARLRELDGDAADAAMVDRFKRWRA